MKHKTIEDVLNEEVKFKDSSKMFYKEMKQNFKLEALCILTCEAGEWLTEIIAFSAGATYQNEVGILGGIAAGGSYALYHVYKHAKKHNSKNVSFADAAGYAASTESGCVIGATLSEYAAGKFMTATNNPVTLNSAIIRGCTLIPAFAIGLVLMSAFTYAKKTEVARGVGKKGALRSIKPLPSLECKLKKNKLKVKGKNSNFLIKEKKLPKTYQNDFNKETDSLYIIKSRIARSKPECGHVIQEYCKGLFKEAGHDLEFVDNIYSCSEHHDH